MSASKPITIKFDRNKKFLAGGAAAGVSFNASLFPDVALALANNTPFPQRQIELGNAAVNASASKDIKFGDGAGNLTFSGSASAFAKLGVYFDPGQMLAALELDDDIAPGMNVASDANSLFVALRWGYDLDASAKGSLAFGAPGAVSFSTTGSREAKYAVVRRFDKNTGALDCLTETVNSWMLPSQIDSLDDFKPGTWLVAEIDGSLAVKLGAQFGFDFNWIRQAQLGGLSGDMGLRLQLGISVALGFQASGKYALVVGRDSMDDQNKQLRLRLFKQRMKGWNFALNASAIVQPQTFLPSDFDDFVKAVFGVYGPQVIKDLELIRQWTDPSQSLPDLLSGVSIDYAKKLLQEVTGIDPEALFNEAKSKLVGFIDQWNQLPHDVATRLWNIVEKETNLDALKGSLTEIRDIAQKIAGANQDTVKGILAEVLKNVSFFQTPLGQWLESAAAGRILTALTSLNEFKQLQKIAQMTSDILTKDILSGNPLDSLLVKLQQFVSTHLNLAQVEKIIDQASFDKADEWLKAKLAAFLGRELDLAAVNQIRETIHTLLGKGEEFYAKAVKALNSKYNFQLSYAYQTATTATALLDIVFDFSQPEVVDSLKQALSGNYDTLLVNTVPGVSLNQAVLTHEIKRSSHLEVSLPFYNSTIDHINQSLAKLNVVDEEEGRLLIYELDADDIVTVRNKRDSRLAIGGNFKVAANEVRVYSTDALSYSYSFRQVKEDMKRADLQFQLKPYVDAYFPKTFQPTVDGAGSFVTLIGDLDRAIDQIEPNGTDNFGNTLISLQVSLPSAVASAWLKAPQDEKSPRYMDMSRRLQMKLRQLIPYYYFQNVRKYGDIASATVLLVYAALPDSTSAKLVDDQFTINTDTDVYWNFPAIEFRRAMVNHPRTLAKLSADLARVNELLLAYGMTGTAGFFAPARAELLQNEALQGANDGLLRSLLFVEADIIRGAHKAALKLANEFAPVAGSKPSEAVEALSEFGAEITETFNNNIRSLFGGDRIRPLGTMAFIEAAAALDPTLSLVEPVATMDLIVVKEQSQFQLPGFLEGETPGNSDIVIQQRFVNL
ncbi:MAG: hypothetical protein AB1631_20485 [Acidobacteriota bacterium]